MLLPVILLCHICLDPKMVVDHFSKRLLILLAYLFVINVITDIYCIVFLDTVRILEENVIIKSIKSLLYMIYNIVYYLLVYNMGKELTAHRRLRPFVVTFFFLVFILVVELFTMPNAWRILHYNTYSVIDEWSGVWREYNRVRLTTTESSLTVPLIVTFGSLTLYYYRCLDKNRLMYIVSIACVVLFIATSTARTLLIFLTALLMYVVLRLIVVRKKRRMWLLVIIPFFFLFPIGLIELASILNERIFMQSLGSLTTRGTSLIAALIHMLRYPFGMGNSASIITMHEIMRDTIQWVSQHVSWLSLNFYELNAFMDGKYEGLGAFGIFSYALYWGVAGTVYLYYAVIQLHRSYHKSASNSLFMSAVFWGYIAMMSLTVPINNCFPFWGFLAIVSLFGADDNNVLEEHYAQL